MDAKASEGMTLGERPAWSPTGEAVLRSNASSDRRAFGSETRLSSSASARDGRSIKRSPKLDGKPSAPPKARSTRLAAGVTRAGSGLLPRRMSARASLKVALSSRGMEPWASGPRAFIWSQAAPFCATWMG